MRRDPIIVSVGEVASVLTANDRLRQPPIVLTAARWKTLLRVIYIAFVGSIFIAISFLQPGVCRAVSLAAYAPLVIWSFGTAAICLWRPERLELRPEGLRHVWLWLDRRWTWNELRDITLIKRQIPFFGWLFRKRPTVSLYFKRYQPAGQATGPARAGVRSVWSESGEDVAQLLGDSEGQVVDARRGRICAGARDVSRVRSDSGDTRHRLWRHVDVGHPAVWQVKRQDKVCGTSASGPVVAPVPTARWVLRRRRASGSIP